MKLKRGLEMRSRQGGGVLMLAGISLAALIGFLGIVVDLGRLFVTKTELQSAMDACALAGAAELKPGVNPPDTEAIARAVSAGITAGTRNRVGFQAAAVTITPADIYFSDSLSDNSGTFPFGYVPSATADPATARYALCARNEGGIATWFMHVLQGFVGKAPTPNTVRAWATATLKPAQISCAIPIGLCNPNGSSGSPYQDMVPGRWFSTLETTPKPGGTGSFGWIDFTPPAGGTPELAEQLKGSGACSVPVAGTQVGEQGNKDALEKAWNTRFGLYHGPDSPATATPDYTGYAYTPLTWPSMENAFGGVSGGTPNFQAARAGKLTYQSTPGGGTWSASSTELATLGSDRRLVVVPVINPGPGATPDPCDWEASTPQTLPVLGYACVLMLHPMTHPIHDPLYVDGAWLEYRGAANDPNSPCNTSGVAGGTAGPLVPVLVH